MGTRMRRLMSAATSVMALAGASSVAAQDSVDQPRNGASEGLADIVVTAQKRSENVQDVPVAITAFSGEAIAQRGITGVQQLGALSPGVNLDETSPFSGSYNVLAASIRGVGQDDFALNVDPGVGVYVDGVYLARTVGANQDLMDVERIEVLKGPQGTLFGRNSIGGAISIVTTRPKDEFSGQAKVTLGTRNRRDFQAFLNIPLTEKILSTLSASSRQQDGFQKRIAFPGQENYYSDPYVWQHAGNDRSDKAQGGKNLFSIRGKLLLLPADDLEITVSADWAHEDSPSTAATVLATDGTSSAFLANIYNTCISNSAAALAGIGLGAVCGPRAMVGTALAGANIPGSTTGPRLPWGNLSVANTGNIDTTYANGLNFTKIDSYGGSMAIDYDFGAEISLKSITAYRELHWKAGMDNDGSILQMNEPSFPIDEWQFSQELQATGKLFDGAVDYAAGLYYFKEKGTTSNYVVLAQGLLQAAPSLGYENSSEIGAESYAAYAHINWKLSDRLGLTLGARYTRESKTIEGNQADINYFGLKFACGSPPFDPACVAAAGYPVPTMPERLFPEGRYKLNYNVFTPRIGAEYHVTNDIMAYASYSRGFKAGGFNERLTAAALEAPSFRPERNDAYEAGIKTELFNRRLRLNVAGFIQDYKNIQLLLTLENAASPLFGNSGDAKIKGFEAEATMLLAKGLTISSGLSHINARYTRVESNAEIGIDTKLPKTPSWKFFVSPNFEHSLPSGGKIRIGGDYTHTTSLFNDVANNPIVARAPTEIVNGQVTYTLPGGVVDFSVGGRNLTNERYKISGFINRAAGAIGANYSAPREWFASVAARF